MNKDTMEPIHLRPSLFRKFISTNNLESMFVYNQGWISSRKEIDVKVGSFHGNCGVFIIYHPHYKTETRTDSYYSRNQLSVTSPPVLNLLLKELMLCVLNKLANRGLNTFVCSDRTNSDRTLSIKNLLTRYSKYFTISGDVYNPNSTNNIITGVFEGQSASNRAKITREVKAEKIEGINKKHIDYIRKYLNLRYI